MFFLFSLDAFILLFSLIAYLTPFCRTTNFTFNFLILNPQSLDSTLVQLLSLVQLFASPWAAAHKASLSLTISQSSLELTSIELMMPYNNLVLCHPLLLLPSIFPRIRVFSNEAVLCIRWPKNWSFSFSISPSNEYSGQISFRVDWFDLLAVHKGIQIGKYPVHLE